MMCVDATGTTMALASIHVNEIPDEGKRLVVELEPHEIGLSETDVKFRGPLTLSADLERADAVVTVGGMIEGTNLLECVRCLSPFESDLIVSFSAEYRPEEAPKQPATGAATAAEADQPERGPEEDEDAYPYRKDQVDLAEMLREQVLLSLPMHPLCKDACRGLCPVCGQNRNVTNCQCQEAQPESPFAVLKKLGARSKRP
jgi:uncharacterized protein